MSDFCRTCRAPVMWLDNVTTGKRAPIDASPATDGNIVVDTGTGTYRVLPELERAGACGQTPLHLNHFVTCEQSAAWKKRTAKAAGP
jgi:hypothetical protein